jgi:hypothetical protein
MFAALDVPMVSVPADAGRHAAHDDLHQLVTLLHSGARDFEVTRPSWWLSET